MLFAVATVAGFALGVSTSLFAAESSPRKLGDLGKVGAVSFPTSCDPSLQAEFERGVALLHSFFYEEARRVFTEVARKDSECAMAHWGIAMTYYHPIWTAPDSTEMAAGLAAVEKALAAKKTSDRERGYIRAVEAYYKGLDMPELPDSPGAPSCHGPSLVEHRGRAACFKREMEKLAQGYPEDLDASAFYALSLLGTAPPADPTLANQKRAAEILETWYAKNKNHPGLAHYLIHSYDYPPLAELGLPAAQAYAAMQPWVPHALHMPSHIFTRLGMWQENIESNLASAEAARRYAAQYHPGAASFEELHALDYLMYGYLQKAQDERAREVLARLAEIKKTHPESDFLVAYAFGAMPARYALERRQWKEAAALEVPSTSAASWSKFPFAEGHIAYARAVGAAQSGDVAGARAAAERLRELASSVADKRFTYFAEQIEIQRQAALGLIAKAEGKPEDGMAILTRAAALEDSLGKHPVSPGAMLPLRELLGEALLEAGKPAEALAAFQASLAIYPNRFNGLYGAARAAEKAGRRPEAERHYAALLELANAKESDAVPAPRPEIAEARRFVMAH
jgi:tetratricopeptide (TPR) repeat protein